MISDNIKALRTKKGMTQKELAEKLYVTAQAVSRWENGDVEPSLETIAKLSAIFDVSTDELIGVHEKEQADVDEGAPEREEEKTDAQPMQEQKPLLAVCEVCNRPIYNGEEIVRVPHHHRRGNSSAAVKCIECDKKQKAAAHKAAVEHGILQRKRSFGWGIFITLAVLGIALPIAISQHLPTGTVVGIGFACLLVFPFVSCLFLENNFIGGMVAEIASVGFVQMPGVIFSFDLDGCLALITIKVALWMIGFGLSAAILLFGIAVGISLSVFVYPFALIKNFESPELSTSL